MNPSRAFRGFTIIELLVAASITVLLASFIFVIVRSVSTTWARSTGRLGADAQARVILNQLELDLHGALFRDDGNASTWMAINIVDATNNTNPPGLWVNAATIANAKPNGANGSLILTSTNISDDRFGMAGVWLRFFTTSRGTNTAATPTTISAPVAVGYQIIRRFTATNPANLNAAYLLHRAEARPAATGTGTAARPGVLESGYNIRAAAYTTNNGASNNGSVTGDPRSIQVPGVNTGTRNLDSVLADNVIDFGVRAYVRDSSVPGGLRVIFPVDATGKLGGNATTRLISSGPSSSLASGAAVNTLFPDVIDVMVRILTDQGAQLIANMEKSPPQPATRPIKYPNAAQWWWGVAQENSRVYTRRIVLNANAL